MQPVPDEEQEGVRGPRGALDPAAHPQADAEEWQQEGGGGAVAEGCGEAAAGPLTGPGPPPQHPPPLPLPRYDEK